MPTHKGSVFVMERNNCGSKTATQYVCGVSRVFMCALTECVIFNFPVMAIPFPWCILQKKNLSCSFIASGIQCLFIASTEQRYGKLCLLMLCYGKSVAVFDVNSSNVI